MFFLICSSISLGSKSIFIFKASKTSPEPHLEETALLPCFATFIPILDRSSAEAVEILSVFIPSPPVPHVSIQSLTLTLLDLSLNTKTPPAISSELSPLDESRVKKSKISSSEALPFIRINKVPYGDRSNSIIEPFLTEQWFADAEKLSVKAKEVVNSKKTNFFPENWSKTYFQWMNNIEPWCISRQLWWGHQIPAWYGPDKKIFVAYNEEEAKNLANKHYGKNVELIRDPDVLDTWFSSGLWPFATLGWPDDKNYVEKFYPTSVLVTGFDIIFVLLSLPAILI